MIKSRDPGIPNAHVASVVLALEFQGSHLPTRPLTTVRLNLPDSSAAIDLSRPKCSAQEWPPSSAKHHPILAEQTSLSTTLSMIPNPPLTVVCGRSIKLRAMPLLPLPPLLLPPLVLRAPHQRVRTSFLYGHIASPPVARCEQESLNSSRKKLLPSPDFVIPAFLRSLSLWKSRGTT